MKTNYKYDTKEEIMKNKLHSLDRKMCPSSDIVDPGVMYIMVS